MDAGSLSLGQKVFGFFLNGEGTFIFYRFGVVLLINETRDYRLKFFLQRISTTRPAERLE